MLLKKKIMLIEDQALLNNMLQKVLTNDYEIVCSCTSAKDMLILYQKYTPDLILTDVVTKEDEAKISNLVETIKAKREAKKAEKAAAL